MDCGQDDDKVAVTKHVVHIDAEYTPGKVHHAPKAVVHTANLLRPGHPATACSAARNDGGG
jgi:hypothetical protein